MTDGSALWLVLRMVLSLLAVLAVLLACLWVLQRRGVGVGRAGATVEVLARQALGRSASVQVVRVGERILLLGVTDAAVRVLTELSAADLDTEGAPPAVRDALQPRRGSTGLMPDLLPGLRREGRHRVGPGERERA